MATYMEFPNHAHWIYGEPGWERIAGHIDFWLCQNDAVGRGLQGKCLTAGHCSAIMPRVAGPVQKTDEAAARIRGSLWMTEKADVSVERDPLYVAYHDEEWGVPSDDEKHLFEMLILEGAQAGLSWRTLGKRARYREAFDRFDVERVAAYTEADIRRLLGDAGIVRNRLKIEAAVRNARGVLAIREEFGSLDSSSGAVSIIPPGRMRGTPSPKCPPGRKRPTG